MKVLVISGFLGAGKTTFIKTLLKRTGIYAAILENEYGETDLDKRALEKDSPLQVLEFMEGCVCCTKKDSFVNTILAISAGLDPDYLVVEPSGIGKLSAIIENIGRVSYERIVLLGSVLVVAPRSLCAVMTEYPDIVTDQIANADRIVLSKIENEDADVIAEAVREIRKYNPDAEILDTHYSQAGDTFWQGIVARVEDAGRETSSVRSGQGSLGQVALSAWDGQNGVEEGSSSGENGTTDETQTEEFVQVTLREASLPGFGDLVVFLEDVLHGTFGDIVRAKGVLRVGNDLVRFDVADGLYAVIGEEDKGSEVQCVFIGKNPAEEKLRIRLCDKTPQRMKPVHGAL